MDLTLFFAGQPQHCWACCFNSFGPTSGMQPLLELSFCSNSKSVSLQIGTEGHYRVSPLGPALDLFDRMNNSGMSPNMPVGSMNNYNGYGHESTYASPHTMNQVYQPLARPVNCFYLRMCHTSLKNQAKSQWQFSIYAILANECQLKSNMES